MNIVIDFSATPLGHAVLAWLVLGLCTLVFKKRTPEEYAKSAGRHPAWLFARVTAFWQFLGGLGLDPVKVSEALGKVISGRVQPLALGVVAVKDEPTAKKLSSAPPPVVKDDDSGPYRDGLAALLILGALSLSTSGCTPAGQQTAKTVTNAALTVAQIACLFASAETTDTTVASVCGISNDLLPVVRQLIGQREGAKKVGVTWTPTDAGAP